MPIKYIKLSTKMLGNTNALRHGRYSRAYEQNRANRAKFMRECNAFIEEMEVKIKQCRAAISS